MGMKGGDMTGWTPGPWRYQEKSDAYTHIVRTGSNGRGFLCQLLPDATGTSEANARLITAAPDMYTALARIEPNIGWRGKGDNDTEQFYCEFCAGTHLDYRLVPHHDECPVHQIREAMRKARGEE